MWIETPFLAAFTTSRSQFIRQQWRMWIETVKSPSLLMATYNSFASNGECGLKQECENAANEAAHGIHSPAMANVD